MAEISKYTPGTFCWTDLGTPNVSKAKEFYSGLFEWKVQDVPMGTNVDQYSLMQVQGKNVCALYSMSADQIHTKATPRWLAYISVSDVDETIKKVKGTGGAVVRDGVDVKDSGRMAVLKDPTGGVFAIWHANKYIGAELNDAAGTVCWRELMTSNIDYAGKFYASVFDWQAKASDVGDMKYLMFSKGDEGVAGMISLPDQVKQSAWLTYWTVDDCEKTVGTAKKLGGQILKSTTVIPEMGRFAVLADRDGASFGVMQFD